MIDAYEAHPELLARWHGAEDPEKAIKGSFESLVGEGRQILERVRENKISVDTAVVEISRIIEEAHKRIH